LEDRLAEFKREVLSGEYVKPSKITFQAFVPIWRENYALKNLGAYTRRNYMGIIESRLIPEFGHHELENIKTMHIVEYFSRLRKTDARKDNRSIPLSTNTLLNIYKVLKSILDNAKKWNLIAVNPMDGVDRPIPAKTEKREMKQRKRSYGAAEAEKAIAALYQEPETWRLYFIGVLLGGFRRGEYLATEWNQVDFKLGGIQVEKQITFDEDGNAIEGELKTEESEAFVPMPQWYMDELKKFRKKWIAQRNEVGTQWRGGDKQYVFHSGFGGKYYPNTPSLTWRRILKRHDLPPIRLHDLRHSTSKILREDGVDLKAIQERLRHTRLETTANIYTAKSEKISRYTANRLEKLNPFTRPQSVPSDPPQQAN